MPLWPFMWSRQYSSTASGCTPVGLSQYSRVPGCTGVACVCVLSVLHTRGPRLVRKALGSTASANSQPPTL
eukprot:2795267-Rhodomonas_salina.5